MYGCGDRHQAFGNRQRVQQSGSPYHRYLSPYCPQQWVISWSQVHSLATLTLRPHRPIYTVQCGFLSLYAYRGLQITQKHTSFKHALIRARLIASTKRQRNFALHYQSPWSAAPRRNSIAMATTNGKERLTL